MVNKKAGLFNLKEVTVENARSFDSDLLTEIAYTAKRHWDYPDNYMEIWNNELIITSVYISSNIVYNAVFNQEILGFYSIVENKSDFCSGEVFVEKGFWLEHIFIKPEYHHKGVGRLLIDHAKTLSRSLGIKELLIFVDPFARGFYDKLGAEFLYDSKSSIKNRTVPVYRLKV